MQCRHSVQQTPGGEKEEARRVPEKKFLLIHAQPESIHDHTNANSLILPKEGGVEPIIAEWIAKGHPLTQVGMYHRSIIVRARGYE